ncbi:MAG: hypothetical protein PHN72_06305 [Bacilli bacterium]|nr:hypothetical protein [Bacilli bacterium]
MAKETNTNKKEKLETEKKEIKKGTGTSKTTVKKSTPKTGAKTGTKKSVTKEEPKVENKKKAAQPATKTAAKKTTKKKVETTSPKATSKTAKESTKKETKVEPVATMKKEKNQTAKTTAKRRNVERHPETKNVSTAKSDEITKLVEIILVILVIFATFYLITYWVDHSKKKTTTNKNESTDNAVIQYDEILIGNILNQSPSTYYVLIMTKEDKTNKVFSTYTTNYSDKEGSLRLYTANLDDAFNKTYKSDSSKLDTENIEEVKVKENTLIKVENNKIVESIEGTSNIQNKLSE